MSLPRRKISLTPECCLSCPPQVLRIVDLAKMFLGAEKTATRRKVSSEQWLGSGSARTVLLSGLTDGGSGLAPAETGITRLETL